MLAGLVRLRSLRMALAVAAGCLAGCQAIVSRPEPRLAGPQVPPPFGEAVPTEKEKVTLPTYVIEPPDILFIEALRVVPKPPYHLQANDVVSIDMELGDEDEELGPQRDNRYVVSASGRSNLGSQLRQGHVGGLTEDEATEAILDKLKETYAEPKVSVQLHARPAACSRSPASTWSRPTARSTWAPTARCTWPA